jgi:hypothetical protein
MIKTTEISMMELRTKLGEIIIRIKLGETFILLHGKNKKQVAVIHGLPCECLSITINSAGKKSYSK